MNVLLSQHERKYEDLFNKAYNIALVRYPTLDILDITLDTQPLQYNVEVAKGTDEDEGKYKISIKLEKDSESTLKSFYMGLAMILYDNIYGETDFGNLNNEKKLEFIRIYNNIKGE